MWRPRPHREVSVRRASLLTADMNLQGISGKVGRSGEEAGKAIAGLPPAAFLEPFEPFC